MAVDMKIGESAWEKLPDALKSEYKKDAAGDYVLDLKGYEDPAELRRARDHEKTEAANAKREAAKEKTAREAAEAKVADMEKNGGKVEDAVAAVRTELETKHTAEIAARDAQIESFRTGMQTSAKTSLAKTIASELSAYPHLIQDHVAKRIGTAINDKNEVETFFTNEKGDRLAATADDIKKEFLKDKNFAPILRATQATGGGGAPSRQQGGGGAPQSIRGIPFDPARPEDLTKLDPKAFAERIAAKKEAEGRA